MLANNSASYPLAKQIGPPSGEYVITSIERAAKRNPKHLAVICGNDTLTYEALFNKIDNLAALLQ